MHINGTAIGQLLYIISSFGTDVHHLHYNVCMILTIISIHTVVSRRREMAANKTRTREKEPPHVDVVISTLTDRAIIMHASKGKSKPAQCG